MKVVKQIRRCWNFLILLNVYFKTKLQQIQLNAFNNVYLKPFVRIEFTKTLFEYTYKQNSQYHIK